MLGALLQIIMSLVICFVNFDDNNIAAFIICAMLVVCGKAWMSPVIEGLMVV